MADFKYYKMLAPIKVIAQAFQSEDAELPEMEETTAAELKTMPKDDNGSVMTVCDNFVTIYGHPTWLKKFAR